MNRLLAILAVVSLAACTAHAPAPTPDQVRSSEVPITSKSTEAVDHFKKGRDLFDNIRFAEAVVEFNKAIELDADFAMALAYRGIATPSARGLTDLEQANTKIEAAATLKPGTKAVPFSKAEQLFVAAALAGRRGELAKSEGLWKQTVDAAPKDWRAQMALAQALAAQDKRQEAIDVLNRAASLDPNAGPLYNQLGYLHLQQGETGPAVEALKKYAAVSPNEPNPHDSLGEALMASGDFAGAETEFRKAFEVSPKFSVALEGVAYTKYFRGDWKGGNEALAEAHKAASRPADRAQYDTLGAIASYAEGKPADGLRQINALQTSPDASSTDIAFVPLYRAMASVEGSRKAEAIADVERALSSAENGKLPPFATNNLRRWALTVRAAAEGLSNDAAGLEKTVAALQKEASARTDDPQLQSSLHFAQGMQAAAKKDMKAARAQFEQCATFESYCHWQAYAVSRTAGDREGAEAARARLTKLYLRDPVYLYARSVVDRTAPKGKSSN